jgi:hypothetical protein
MSSVSRPVLEQAREARELGVGIYMLPYAV